MCLAAEKLAPCAVTLDRQLHNDTCCSDSGATGHRQLPFEHTVTLPKVPCPCTFCMLRLCYLRSPCFAHCAASVGASGYHSVECPLLPACPQKGHPWRSQQGVLQERKGARVCLNCLQSGCGSSQVQGLMDVFDRDWCNLFVWTVNGSTLFHIRRDPLYWNLCFQGLAEFWWSHVIPGKHELAAHGPGAEERYRYSSSASAFPSAVLFRLLKGMQSM